MLDLEYYYASVELHELVNSAPEKHCKYDTVCIIQVVYLIMLFLCLGSGT